MSTQTRLGGAVALFAAFLLLGCKQTNPNAPARVSGKVTYNGSPVTGGSVTFHFKEGGPITMGISEDGSYSGTDIPAGDAVVTVETESINPDKKHTTYGAVGGVGSGPAAMYGKRSPVRKAPEGKGEKESPAPEGATTANLVYVKIPKKYSDPATSGLTVTLKPGNQTHNIALTD
jgi:hypothetical protein